MKKVPVYRQLESADCGLTCLRMISAYYGKKYTLKTLKSHCEIGKLGVSVRNLIRCGESIGMVAKSVNITMSELQRMPLPAILFWKQGHFVVLENIKNSAKEPIYNIIDPENGRLALEKEHFEDKWLTEQNGIAIVLAPKHDFLETNPEINEGPKDSLRLWKLLLRKYWSFKKSFLAVGILSLLTMVMSWAMPLILMKTVDDGIMAKDIGIVWMMLLAQFVFFIGFSISNNINTLIISKTGFKLGINLISDYLQKIVNLPIGFFETRFSSELIQKLNDQERIKDFVTTQINVIIFGVINIVVFTAIFLYFNYKIFLIFLGFTLLSLAYNSLFIKKRKYLDYASYSVEARKRNSIYELIMGMREIQINNAQEQRVAIWEKYQNESNKIALKEIYLGYYMDSGTLFFSRFKDILTTGICALFVINGEMTLGTMMTIGYLLGMLSAPLDQLISFITIIQDTKLSHDRVSEIMDIETLDPLEKLSLAKYSISRKVSFQNVSFKYPGTENYVLKKINLELPKNKITALVGSSGSGKTTLMKLLLGFYPPQEGEILLDDLKFSQIDLKEWRSKCGVVMQDGFIFSGTIANNIALSETKPDVEKLNIAAKTACIYDFIEELPMGYRTIIGEEGIPMSGGQEQRVCLARALYNDPEFIFMDEATSSLDANTEKEILRNLTKVYQNKTVLIIAHRLSTVRNADNIIYMDNGCIIEQGTHSQLVNLKGFYYQLIRNQIDDCD